MSKILIVDDSKTTRLLIQSTLNKNGFEDTVAVNSAKEAFKILNLENPSDAEASFDLIMMDLMMPDMDGIDALIKIKTAPKYKDLPCIMLTGDSESNSLQEAFNAGATDYVSKSVNKIELLARVRSAIRFKKIMDRYDELLYKYEQATLKLEKSNIELLKYNTKDLITGLSNQRYFEEFLDLEWRRMIRTNQPMSLIIFEPDFFKEYYKTYGAQTGKDCLKFIGIAIKSFARRPGDLVAYLGEDRFGVVLSDTDLAGLGVVAENMRRSVDERKIPHEKSNISHLTISVGGATVVPNYNLSPEKFVEMAVNALISAKQKGINSVKIYGD